MTDPPPRSIFLPPTLPSTLLVPRRPLAAARVSRLSFAATSSPPVVSRSYLCRTSLRRRRPLCLPCVPLRPHPRGVSCVCVPRAVTSPPPVAPLVCAVNPFPFDVPYMCAVRRYVAAARYVARVCVRSAPLRLRPDASGLEASPSPCGHWGDGPHRAAVSSDGPPLRLRPDASPARGIPKPLWTLG